MKILIRLSLLAVVVLFGCAPDAPSVSDYSNPNAQYAKNVSALYGLVTSTGPIGVDVKWRDSTGVVRKLSDYVGKPVIVAFGRTSDLSSDTLYRELDSIKSEMGDSVFTLAVAKDNTGFITVSTFASSQNIKTQMISDSSSKIQLQFVLHTDGLIYTPESFVLDTTVKIDTKYVTEGREDKETLKKYARLLMKH